MTGPEDLLLAMARGSVIGAIITVLLVPLSIIVRYQLRLKDDVGKRKAIKLFPIYAKYELQNTINWRQFIEIAVKLSVAGSIGGGLFFVFYVGIITIF